MSWNLKIRRNTNTARLLRRYGLALRLTGCFGAIFAATVAVGLEDSGNLVWVANGLLLSYLLLAPKWLWKITTPELPKSLIERNMCLAVDLDDASLLSQCVGKTKHPQVFLRRVEELYANPEAEDQCQVELKDGRTLERYSTSLRNENGEYLGRVWFFRDITRENPPNRNCAMPIALWSSWQLPTLSRGSPTAAASTSTWAQNGGVACANNFRCRCSSSTWTGSSPITTRTGIRAATSV